MFKTLVIDDEKAFTDIVERFMSGFSEVSVFATAKEGFSAYKLLNPDIVIVDNQLPDMKGVDLVKQMRAGQEAYIVMVTIDKEDETSALLKPCCVDVFLKKPFRRADLEKVLLEAIVTVKRKRGGA